MNFISRQTVPLDEIIPNIQTGDLILMQGTADSSKIIRSMTNCEWSHAAMLIWGRDLGLKDYENTLLLWESSYNSKDVHVQDVILKEEKRGPQLVILEERLTQNFAVGDNDKFSIRHMHVERTSQMFEALEVAMKEVHHDSFPELLQELQYPIMGREHGLPSPKGTFFCSQLLAYTLMAMGLLTKRWVNNSYLPVDFSETFDVSLLKGGWFGKEIFIDTSNWQKST